MLICYIFVGILLAILLIHSLLEINYFLRCCLSVIIARIFKKKLHILSKTMVKGICLTTDIDSLFTHMNNARFVRELDFAKIDFFERTGMYSCIKKFGGCIALSSTTIRYRKFIKLFSKYLLTTKIIYWDEASIFMEHRFITPSDNFINAIVLCRLRLIDCNTEDVMKELLTRTNKDPESDTYNCEKPEIPPELAKWIEYNELSSTTLRIPA